MKKIYIATVVAVVIGLITCPLGIAATDAQTGMNNVYTESIRKGTSSDASPKTSKGKSSNEASEAHRGTPSDATSRFGSAGNLSLQIPQKLEVMIDPFDIDGKGQIHSEQYIIQNRGETTGILTLSFICKLKDNSNLEIKQDKDEIHHGEDKSIYMEIVFKDTERMILSQESSEYQAKLEPGDEVSLYFTGEVNENAIKPWKDSDIAIEGIYKWSDVEEELLEEDVEEDFVSEVDQKTENNLSINGKEQEEGSLVSKNDLEESSLVNGGDLLNKGSLEGQEKDNDNKNILEEKSSQEVLEKQEETSAAEEENLLEPSEKQEETSKSDDSTEEKNLQESAKGEGEQQEKTSGNGDSTAEETVQDAFLNVSEKDEEIFGDKEDSKKDVSQNFSQDVAGKQEVSDNKELSEKNSRDSEKVQSTSSIDPK